MFNDEIATMTYFKDITFGVLYEQVKAQQQLQSAISQTLQSKMGVPLKNIVTNCRELENSEQLETFENTNGNVFRQMIQNVRMASNLVVFHLRDMHDWNLLKTNNFRNVSTKFSLLESLSEVYEMMKMKAVIKDLKLEFDSEKGIPTQVIGDKLRLQQIMINLVQNAITYTTEGAVKVNVSYMEQEERLLFIVEDTGIGIKAEDYDKVFKIFKDQESISLGLSICKEIAHKFNGSIIFESEF